MSDENKTIVIICLTILVAFFFALTIPLTYHAGKQQRIVDMVKGGVSPLEAGCALDLEGNYRSACDAVIARKE